MQLMAGCERNSRRRRDLGCSAAPVPSRHATTLRHDDTGRQVHLSGDRRIRRVRTENDFGADEGGNAGGTAQGRRLGRPRRMTDEEMAYARFLARSERLSMVI